MKNPFLYVALLVLMCWMNEIPVSNAQEFSELKIDPSLLISLKECRQIYESIGDQLFPGWDFKSTPILFYRPDVQELLINYPHQPEGFSLYTGFNPLNDKKIYVRNGTTTIPYDDQNTSREIDSISVLVVSDPFSTIRNQFNDMLGRPKDIAMEWLNKWQFIPDPYFKLQVIFHEAFHVYQNRMAPDKYADESAVSQYPLLDPENNALYVLEGNILKDALLANNPQSKLEAIRKFIAVRIYRQSRLDSSFVAYENLNEYEEGLAKYVEYKFMQLGEKLKPIPEMNYVQGFNGYEGVLSKKFLEEIDNMVNIVAVNDDRFGNKFGSGPLRFKLYDLGACEALLLDGIMPQWKESIFKPNVYLTDLLKQSLNLTNDQLKQYLDKAKAEYHYDEAYSNKVEFETEGKKIINEKIESIMKTDKTLVKISYSNLTQSARVVRYTPFGVTQISKNSAIYDMIPILVYFKKDCKIDFKQAIPVIVDQDRKQIIFSSATPPSKFVCDEKNKLDLNEFSFTYPMDIQVVNNVVSIQIKP
jgi:hypothetical protein